MARQSFFKKPRWEFPKYGDDWKTISDACKARDGYKCTECGAPGKQIGGLAMLQAHHIVSKSRGGRDELQNLATVCTACHSKEHSHMQKSMERWKV